MLATTITLHLLSVIIWVGGMFFAHNALRPVANALLEPPVRLPFMSQVLGRFFVWVWTAIIVLWVTGLWIIFGFYGGMAKTPLSAHLMLGVATIMTVIFCYIFVIPYSRLREAISLHHFPEAGQHLAVIRKLIATNLLLGIGTTVIATVGKYYSG